MRKKKNKSGVSFGMDNSSDNFAPAPVWSCNVVRNISTVTLYSSHERRMMAVIDAARSGNGLLLKWALDHHDKYGSDDVDDDGKPIEHRLDQA